MSGVPVSDKFAIPGIPATMNMPIFMIFIMLVDRIPMIAPEIIFRVSQVLYGLSFALIFLYGSRDLWNGVIQVRRGLKAHIGPIFVTVLSAAIYAIFIGIGFYDLSGSYPRFVFSLWVGIGLLAFAYRFVSIIAPSFWSHFISRFIFLFWVCWLAFAYLGEFF